MSVISAAYSACTDGLQRKYGEHRVLDTPIAEGGIVAAAIGMGVNGLKPVAEIQFADYIYPAFDQVVSELARLRYRTAGNFSAPVTIRTPCGGGIRGGQTHSQSSGRRFSPTSAASRSSCLRTPYDAKGLLISSIEGDDPVVFFEPKRIYNGPFDGDPHKPAVPWSSHPRGEVPEGYYTVPIGRAEIVRPGSDVTVLAYGTMVHVVQAAVRLRASMRKSWTCARSCRSMSTPSARRSARPAAASSCTRPPVSAAIGAELVATVQEDASGTWRRRSSASRVGTLLIHTRSSGSTFPGPRGSRQAIKSVMEAA